MTLYGGQNPGGLLEAAPDAIVAVGVDGRIVLVNAAAERLFGYGRAELVGQPVEMLVPDGVRGAHPGLRSGYLSDPRPRPMGAGMELAARRRDGVEFPAEISLSAIDTEHGLLVTAAIRDVSDRKKAEAKFRGLLEAAPDAIVGVQGDGRIALVNAQAERLFGYDRTELVGQPMEILVPEGVRAAHPGHRGRYFADPQQRPMGAGMALAARRKDGSEFPAEISLSALDTEDGLLVSAAVRDVTDRRAAAEAQSRLASIVQSSHDAIIGKTLDGTITSWNPGATRLYGYPEQEMLGRNAADLFPPHRRGEEPVLLARIAAGQRVEQHQTERLRRDGTPVTVSLTLSPILDTAGIIVGVASVSRDVTEQQRAEARFRGLLESAPDAIVGVDPDGRIALVNAQAEGLFGYGREELVGLPVEILVPDAVRPVHPGHRRGYLCDPKPRPMGAGMALAGRRKDGTEFPAEISLSTLDTEHGVLVSAAIRDVTGRKKAEAKFRGLLEAAPDAIVGVQADGRISLVNAQAERLFGYRREELEGQPVEVLVPDAVRGAHPGHRGRYFADPQQRPMGAGMALAARRKDGSEFPAEISLSALDTEDGLLVSAAIRDVTDRKKAEAKFRGLLEAAPDAIVGVQADGRIALINAQAERLFGYRREELEGQPVEILVPHGVRAAHPAHRSQYFADPQQRPMGADMQLAARRKDGSEFPAEISLSALDTEDGLLVSAAIRDVTDRIEAQAERERLKTQNERERLEAQLHQSQRLESLGQLAGGVAHDFNNLLGAILNYAAFVEEELTAAAAPGGAATRDWATVSRDVEQIRRAAERATNLTHQLLAFGRREIVQPRVLNLNDIVVDIEQLLRRTLGEHIELTTDLTADLWPVLADPGQLEQVLVNLAVNARDAMAQGGTLTIDTANLDIDEDYAAGRHGIKSGRHVRLRVSDTGTGMPKHVLDRVFEPFFTTKPKGEGTGLGLATIYGIITQADGHTQIYSEPGFGTTFTALLPVTDQTPTVVETPVATAHSRGGETVLVVEDEDAMREVTRRILTRNGYHVITAATGADAVEIANRLERDIHLLVTDVIMPKMLGKEVADRIRTTRPGIRVLFMSGYAHPVLASQNTLDPGVTLIEKPFTEPALLNKIKEVLDPHH
jgi:two-component system, cell cycle sensor histidine kinase and response regulator CckA